MIVSKKLMKAISEWCTGDPENYRELYDNFKEAQLKRERQGIKVNNIYFLVKNIISEMQEIGVKEDRVAIYSKDGFAPILFYCAVKSIETYSENEISKLVSAMQIHHENGSFSASLLQNLRKAAAIIATYHKKGYLLRSDITGETKRHLSESFEALIGFYKAKIPEYRSLSESTIISNCTSIRMFLYQFEQQGINEVCQFTFKNMNDCMTSVSKHYDGGLASTLAGIKHFLLLLFEEGVTKDDFSVTVPKPARIRVIREGFSDDETKRILDTVNRETAKGKRDYAIILTAVKTGLRAVDIANLRLKDIDWQLNEITIIQHKTDVPLKLPLPIDVGNAIADYILNARPDEQSDRVFFNFNAPQRVITRKSISIMVKKYMNLSGTNDSGIPGRGIHSARRGFGKRLLESGVAIDMINELMGHSEMNSSKPYLAIDENGLKKCGLGLVGFTQAVTS